jgi:hypothetical protein
LECIGEAGRRKCECINESLEMHRLSSVITLRRPGKREILMWDYSELRSIGVRLCVTIALLLSPVVASPGPLTLYTDREAFLAAANPARLLTFDESTSCIFELIPGETPLGPTTFPQCRYDFGDVQVLSFFPSFAPSVLVDVVPADFTGMTFRLPANTSAVGVDLLQAARTTFQISFAGIAEWNQVYAPPDCLFGQGTPPCEPFSGFVGVISADDGVSIPSVSVQGSPPGFLSPPLQALPYPAVVDNLVWQVPEPATALLLLAGAIALVQRRRFMRAK